MFDLLKFDEKIRKWIDIYFQFVERGILTSIMLIAYAKTNSKIIGVIAHVCIIFLGFPLITPIFDRITKDFQVPSAKWFLAVTIYYALSGLIAIGIYHFLMGIIKSEFLGMI